MKNMIRGVVFRVATAAGFMLKTRTT